MMDDATLSKLFNLWTFLKLLDILTVHLQFGYVFMMNMVIALTSNISVSTLSFKAFARLKKLQWMHTSLASMNSFKNSNTTSQSQFLHLRTKLLTCSSFNHLAMTEIENSLH